MTRLRWRLRGATMWPAFIVAVLAEGVLFELLPFAGDGPDSIVGAWLLAMALNLILVAALAPVAGFVLRRRRRDLPRAIAADVCGTALVGALFVGLIAGGLAHRGELRQDGRDRSASYAAASTYVHNQARDYLPGLDAMDAIKVEDGIYRACIPAADKPLCVFVTVDQSPPGVTRDLDRTPNALWRR